MTARIRELQDNLKLVKKEYKAAQKSLKKSYKEEKRTVKAEIKTARHNKRTLKKEETKKEDSNPSFLQKCDYVKDSTLLKVCEPFEAKAQAIRYKRLDPNGYEADMVVGESENIIEHYEKRVNKGKELKARDIDVLSKLRQTMEFIAEKGDGYRHKEATDLADRISNMLPDVNIEAAQAMIEKFGEAISQFAPQGA